MIFVVILSIPYKILVDEIPKISLKQEIITLKDWLDPFIIFFIIHNIIDNEKLCMRALFGLAILLFITAISTPLISLKIINIGDFYLGRAAGFADPNQYAAYLVLFIPLIFTFVFFHKSYVLRTLSGFVLLASFVALITTGSRGGFLSFFISILLYLFILLRNKMVRFQFFLYIAMALVIISVISFVAAPTSVKKSLSRRLDPSRSESIDDYSAERLPIWRNGLKLFAEKPIFGHGQKTFSGLNTRRFAMKYAAHNQYLDYLVQFGIIGLAAYILLFFKIFQVTWIYQKTAADLWGKKMFISYIAGLLGYTISMMAVDLNVPRAIFWFYTAVFIRYGQLCMIGEEKK